MIEVSKINSRHRFPDFYKQIQSLFYSLILEENNALNGKLFVEFIALIYLSYIKKRMQEEDLFRKWTLQGLLDELDLVECFEAPDHGKMLGEMTKKQGDLYQKLGIDPPSLEIPGI